MTNQTKRYLRQVKRGLPCSRPEKRRYLTELEVDVAAYLQGCPDASVEDLYRNFGEPKAVAKEFMAQLSPEQLSRKMSVKRKILVGVISIMAILAIVLGALACYYADSIDKFVNGYFIDAIDELPSADTPEQEPIAEH